MKCVAALVESKDSKNTQKVVKVAVKLLGDFLIERHNETLEEMEKLSSTEMSSNLKKFYAEPRNPDVTFYAKKTLITIRFALQKYFLKRTSIDIVNSEEFQACNEVFNVGQFKTRWDI